MWSLNEGELEGKCRLEGSSGLVLTNLTMIQWLSFSWMRTAAQCPPFRGLGKTSLRRCYRVADHVEDKWKSFSLSIIKRSIDWCWIGKKGNASLLSFWNHWGHKGLHHWIPLEEDKKLASSSFPAWQQLQLTFFSGFSVPKINLAVKEAPQEVGKYRPQRTCF